jgi:hypothetical protein
MTGLPVIRLGGPDTGSAPGALDRRQWVGAQRRLGGKTRCVSTWRRPDPISPSVRLYALIWGEKPQQSLSRSRFVLNRRSETAPFSDLLIFSIKSDKPGKIPT